MPFPLEPEKHYPYLVAVLAANQDDPTPTCLDAEQLIERIARRVVELLEGRLLEKI